jgi:hypothetical protein
MCLGAYVSLSLWPMCLVSSQVRVLEVSVNMCTSLCLLGQHACRLRSACEAKMRSPDRHASRTAPSQQLLDSSVVA